jgi:hypothetical protein
VNTLADLSSYVVMAPNQQVLLLRMAGAMTDQSDPGSISMVINSGEPEVRGAGKDEVLAGAS